MTHFQKRASNPDARSSLDGAEESVKEYFASQWPKDSEGFFHRRAARVVAVNEKDELLLLRGHDFSDVEHWWWFTVGGGLEPGEDHQQAAIREFFEETGWRLERNQLQGPVLRRHATFEFHELTCRQDEEFFFVRLAEAPVFTSEHITAVEKQVLDEIKWWNLAELATEIARGTVVYPRDIVTLVTGWLAGWDGSVPEITEGTVKKR